MEASRDPWVRAHVHYVFIYCPSNRWQSQRRQVRWICHSPQWRKQRICNTKCTLLREDNLHKCSVWLIPRCTTNIMGQANTYSWKFPLKKFIWLHSSNRLHILNCVILLWNKLQHYTLSAIRLFPRFCKMFSESSTIVTQLPCCPHKQGELSKNCLQNLVKRPDGWDCTSAQPTSRKIILANLCICVLFRCGRTSSSTATSPSSLRTGLTSGCGRTTGMLAQFRSLLCLGHMMTQGEPAVLTPLCQCLSKSAWAIEI